MYVEDSTLVYLMRDMLDMLFNYKYQNIRVFACLYITYNTLYIVFTNVRLLKVVLSNIPAV